MTDPQTARDAAAKAAFIATPSGTTIASAARDYAWDWILSEQAREPWVRQVDAVLLALGIPPDTTVNDVRAGLAALRIASDTGALSIEAISRDGGRTTQYAAESAAAPDYEAEGASPAAAVLALAAKVEEGRDA